MDFYKRMQCVCTRIPYGKVATYGQIALLCGMPKNARQVGYGLHTGLAGEEIPAHRVVNSSGVLTGTASFEYPDMQKLLLEEEGVPVIRYEAGFKVSLKQFGWKNTLQDTEELQRLYKKMGI